MANVKEILAQNIKENRRRLRITQGQFAELAGLSTHYLGMIEIARHFPTADVVERLAAALGIKASELFSVAESPERVLVELQQAVLNNLNQAIEQHQKELSNRIDEVIEHSLERAFERRCTSCPSSKLRHGRQSGKKAVKRPPKRHRKPVHLFLKVLDERPRFQSKPIVKKRKKAAAEATVPKAPPADASSPG